MITPILLPIVSEGYDKKSTRGKTLLAVATTEFLFQEQKKANAMPKKPKSPVKLAGIST